jgi:carbonic anhydrase
LTFYRLKDIVVCGHAPCEMIKRMLADDDAYAEIPSVASAIRSANRTRRIMAENYSHLAGERWLMAAVEENVLVQLENLRTIPRVASRLARGDIHLHAWIYAAGAIFTYDPQLEQFGPLNQ